MSVPNWLMATIVGLPKCAALSRWAARFSSPRSTAPGSDSLSASSATPPCILRARTVATITIAAGLSPADAALQVEELLAAEVEGEAGLGDRVVGHGHRHAGGQDRVAAVGDVGERSAVDERGGRLGRLDEVGQDRLVEDRRHRAGHADLAGQHRLARLLV